MSGFVVGDVPAELEVSKVSNIRRKKADRAAGNQSTEVFNVMDISRDEGALKAKLDQTRALINFAKSRDSKVPKRKEWERPVEPQGGLASIPLTLRDDMEPVVPLEKRDTVKLVDLEVGPRQAYMGASPEQAAGDKKDVEEDLMTLKQIS
jgi:hypothetical protein